MFSIQNQNVDFITYTQLLKQLGFLLETQHPLTIDSRKVELGDIFCAYPGVLCDGREFISQALKQGAQIVLWESGIDFSYNITNYPVLHLQQYVGLLASHQYNYPSRSMLSIAVTGTNGKTSISHWLNQAYAFLGKSAAIIGTTGAGIYPHMNDLAATTPDPITLQRLFNEFRQNQVQVLAMEVSSHALVQGRVHGVEFSTAIFTNLTQDHLDYHVTMDNYYQAKRELFYWQSLKNAVINADDFYGARLLTDLALHNPNLKLISYGINAGDVQATKIKLDSRGVRFELNYAGQKSTIYAPLLGRFNVYNLLAVFASLLANDIEFTQLAGIAQQLKPVVGRMDAKIMPNHPVVVVDFAHTPDALANALMTLNELKGAGRLFCVFGCGGNRDKLKRPIMGQVAAKLADVLIVTSDNPRDEEPLVIINEIIAGVDDAAYQVQVERKLAIEQALAQAKIEDIILIAGKGHEEYQEIKGTKYPFSDLKLVVDLLNE